MPLLCLPRSGPRSNKKSSAFSTANRPQHSCRRTCGLLMAGMCSSPPLLGSVNATHKWWGWCKERIPHPLVQPASHNLQSALRAFTDSIDPRGRVHHSCAEVAATHARKTGDCAPRVPSRVPATRGSRAIAVAAAAEVTSSGCASLRGGQLYVAVDLSGQSPGGYVTATACFVPEGCSGDSVKHVSVVFPSGDTCLPMRRARGANRRPEATHGAIGGVSMTTCIGIVFRELSLTLHPAPTPASSYCSSVRSTRWDFFTWTVSTTSSSCPSSLTSLRRSPPQPTRLSVSEARHQATCSSSRKLLSLLSPLLWVAWR